MCTTKPQAGVPYRGEGSLLTVQTQHHGHSFKRNPPPQKKKKKIIAPTYSHRRMSLNVDHTIHQLWRAQGPSSARTTAPQVVSCLQPPHPPTLHLPCCAQSPSVAGGVVRRPLTPRSCHTNTAPALRLSLLAGIPPHPPVDPAR